MSKDRWTREDEWNLYGFVALIFGAVVLFLLFLWLVSSFLYSHPEPIKIPMAAHEPSTDERQVNETLFITVSPAESTFVGAVVMPILALLFIALIAYASGWRPGDPPAPAAAPQPKKEPASSPLETPGRREATDTSGTGAGTDATGGE